MTPSAKQRVFRLSLDIMVDLSVDDLWPDGDAPENPTEDDVHALISKSGGARQIVIDWNLVTYDDEFDVRELETP